MTEQIIDRRFYKQDENNNVVLKTIRDLFKEDRDDLEYMKALLELYHKRDLYEDKHDGAKKIFDKIKSIQGQQTRQSKQGTPQEWYNFACDMFGDTIHKYIGPDGTSQIFAVKNQQFKLGEVISHNRGVTDTLTNKMAQRIIEEGLPQPEYTEVGSYCKQWLMFAPPVDYKIFGSFNDDSWCLSRCLVKPYAGESHDNKEWLLDKMPVWKSNLNRMTDGDAYAAWWYGVASERYKGRQALHERGFGEDGKTFKMTVLLNNLFPDVAASVSNNSMNGDSQRFVMADFENKVIATWDDCQNTQALRKELVKQLTGSAKGGKQKVEKKGIQAYNAEINCKLFINGNFRPAVDGAKWCTSRLLYVEIEPFPENYQIDPTIGQKMVDELLYFLAYAKLVYEERCPDNYFIQYNDRTKLLLTTLIEQSVNPMVAQLLDHLEFGKFITPASSLVKLMRDLGFDKNWDIKAAYDYLEVVHGVTKPHTAAGRLVLGVRILSEPEINQKLRKLKDQLLLEMYDKKQTLTENKSFGELVE